MARDDAKIKNGRDDALKNLAEFLADPEGISDEEIDQEFNKYRVDIVALTSRVKSAATRALDDDRLRWQTEARVNRDRKLDRLRELREKIAKYDNSKIIEKLNSLVPTYGTFPAMARYREAGPDDMDENEMREILINILSLVDGIDNGL